jgi:hypothetical protein
MLKEWVVQFMNISDKDSEHHDFDEWIVDTLKRVTAFEHRGFSKFNAWEVACGIEGKRCVRSFNSPRMTKGRIWD